MLLLRRRSRVLYLVQKLFTTDAENENKAKGDENMSWKYTHGENDDPLGPGTYVSEAHGVKFDPPLPVAEVGNLIGTISEKAEVFVNQCVKANAELRKHLPEPGSKRELAMKVLMLLLDAHREKTGEVITLVRPGGQPLSEADNSDISKAEREDHRLLIEKYEAAQGEMHENDLNRAFIIRACEDYVLKELQRVGSRSKLSVTLKKLIDYVVRELPFAEEFVGVLLPTLRAEGWVLFNHEGETRILPYGEGVPAYDAKLCNIDHPMWSRTLGVKWEV